MERKITSREELVQIWIAERLEKVPKGKGSKVEKAGRISELEMIQVIAGKELLK